MQEARQHRVALTSAPGATRFLLTAVAAEALAAKAILYPRIPLHLRRQPQVLQGCAQRLPPHRQHRLRSTPGRQQQSATSALSQQVRSWAASILRYSAAMTWQVTGRRTLSSYTMRKIPARAAHIPEATSVKLAKTPAKTKRTLVSMQTPRTPASATVNIPPAWTRIAKYLREASVRHTVLTAS